MKSGIRDGRFEAVDALRGVAALLVAWEHFARTFLQIPAIASRGTWPADISFAVDFGRIGVICFFLISGFVIPSSLKQDTPQPIRVFFVRRFFRLFPAYWVSLAVGLLMLPRMVGERFSAGTIGANLGMIQMFTGRPRVWDPYWTLQVEWVFYALCALLFVAGLLRRTAVLLAACAGFAALYGIAEVLVRNSHPGLQAKSWIYLCLMLSVMLTGSLVRRAFDDASRRNVRAAWVGTVVCFAIPMAVMAAAAAGRPLLAHPYRFGASHLLGLIVFLAGLRLLRHPPRALLWTGTVSYSVYLFHMPVAYGVVWVLEHSGRPVPAGPMLLYMAASLAICLGVAAAVYHGVEKPGIALGRRVFVWPRGG